MMKTFSLGYVSRKANISWKISTPIIIGNLSEPTFPVNVWANINNYQNTCLI